MDATFISPQFMPGGFIVLLIAITAIALGGIWAVLSSSRFAGNESGTVPDRIPQLYGYTICLISLIWAASSVVMIADNAMTLSAPEYRDFSYGLDPSVTSFEAFRITYDRSRYAGMPITPETARLDPIPETELRKRYEVMRMDKVRRGEFRARREMMSSGLSLVIALGLFAFHWRWLRRAFLKSAAV